MGGKTGTVVLSEERQYERKELLIQIELINALKQVRRTFVANDIRALADNICKWGLIDPVTLAVFYAPLCQEYIALTNKYHGSDYKLSDLVYGRILYPIISPCYAILLSGERRLRAHQLIWQEGCSVCQKKYGEEKPGTCFARHFGKDKIIKAHAYVNISPLDAIDIQLSGNSYIPPPDSEMMEICSLQFRVKREKNPKLTIADFARSIGKSPSTISDYLKIFELPPEALDFLQKGMISSGIAREIAFLQDNGEKDLMWWVRRAAFGRLKVEDFRKKVRDHLASRQQTMLEIFDAAAEQVARKAYIKKVVAKEMIEGVYGNISYFKKVLQMLEDGKLGQKDSPFSAKSPTHLYREQVNLMRQQVLPYLASLLPKKSLQEIEETLARVELTLAKQEERVKE